MPERFAGLAEATVTKKRNIYFAEATNGSNGPTKFFITVQAARLLAGKCSRAARPSPVPRRRLSQTVRLQNQQISSAGSIACSLRRAARLNGLRIVNSEPANQRVR